MVTLRWTRFLKFLRCEKVLKEKKISETGSESREWKWEECENENYYLLCDRICDTFLSFSDEDNSVSRTNILVNVFNSATSPPELSYHCVLHYFLTMSVGSHVNFGFKPQVGGIKIVCHCFTNDPFSKLSGCTAPKMIPTPKWSPTLKWSPNRPQNDPHLFGCQPRNYPLGIMEWWYDMGLSIAQ